MIVNVVVNVEIPNLEGKPGKMLEFLKEQVEFELEEGEGDHSVVAALQEIASEVEELTDEVIDTKFADPDDAYDWCHEMGMKIYNATADGPFGYGDTDGANMVSDELFEIVAPKAVANMRAKMA